MSSTNQICPLCRSKKTKGKTTFSADIGSGVVVVREVEATICSQCGEEWIDDATARQLEQIVNDARVRRLQVEVTASEVVARALRLDLPPPSQIKCEAFVTGDQTHFGPLYGKAVGGVKICSPRQLAEIFVK